MSIASKWHRIGELAEKSGKVIRERGFRSFFKKSCFYVKEYCSRRFDRSFGVPLVPPRSVSEMIYIAHENLQPLLVFKSPDPRRPACLNFVTDALGASLLGGVGTALILASQYAARRNMTLRIMTRQEIAKPSDYYAFMDLMHETPPKKVVFWSDCDRDASGRHRHPLEISDSDVFFTDSWWTTSAVRAAETGCKVFYIVQEAEELFYPSGDMRLRCSRQLDCRDVCHIVNSRWLWDYFKNRYPSTVCVNGTWFEPAFPRFLYQPRMPAASGRHKLFFHTNPNHPRNLFFTGLEALEEAVLRGILNPEQWVIYLDGEISDKAGLPEGLAFERLEEMTLADYARFLGEVDMTFSLMCSPNPGYPFLESLASGCVCVTNTFENKKDCPFCKNAIFRDLSVDALCDGLREGVKLALNKQARRKNFKEMSLPSDWSETLKETLGFMEHSS